MRAVIQRVTRASVAVAQSGNPSLAKGAGNTTPRAGIGGQGREERSGLQEIGCIGPGLLVLLGIHREDRREDALWLAEKCAHLRIFEDDLGRMNRSLLDTGGAMLVVSQFTLLGDCRRGRRPSWSAAAPPEMARPLYRQFCERVTDLGVEVQTGRFQAHMAVSLVNDGPVTLLLDSHKNF